MSLLEVKNLTKTYRNRGIFKSNDGVEALKGVSFNLGEAETLAIVGESGCGKSTIAKILMGIECADDGSILLGGKDRGHYSEEQRRQWLQMIFQDPYGSLNPRRRAWQIIAEPLFINHRMKKQQARFRAIAMMERVGLRAQYADRYPHMFSGGQRQRIGIARALMLEPRILICDEPVSALDVSIQAQILNLLMELQREMKLSYLFISHDLSVVRHIADRVAVIYSGKLMELGRNPNLFENPNHPYTELLLQSVPKLSESISFHAPPASELKAVRSGCLFQGRCAYADTHCFEFVPEGRSTESGTSFCHLFPKEEEDHRVWVKDGG